MIVLRLQMDTLIRLSLAPHGGQAIVWTAVMLPLFLSVVGLAIDAGLVFNARRELQNVADAAARAGAMQVDERVYRASAGATVVLDQAAAGRVASEYLTGQGSNLSARIAAEPQRVTVEVERQVPTSFLRLAGINNIRIGASAPAEVRHGIERGSP